MRRARSALIAGATAAVLCLASPAAQAGTIVIQFDLTNSVVSLFGGILSLPPGGTITSATAQVTVQGSGITNASGGAAQLSNLALVATVNGTVGGAVLLTGGISGTQLGGGAANLSGGLANLFLTTLSLNVNGLINCFGGLCPALGTFPASAVNSLSVITGIGNFGIGGLGTLGAATLNGLLGLTLGGNSAAVNLVGQEVSRTFIPEPNTFTLVGLGLLGLGGLGWTRTRKL